MKCYIAQIEISYFWTGLRVTSANRIELNPEKKSKCV